MILLRVIDHDHTQSHTVEEFPCVIGRSMKCDVRIDNSSISARHASIEHRDDGYVLTDLGSTNGIARGTERLPVLRLARNETVWLGDVRVELVVEEALPKTRRNVVIPDEPEVHGAGLIARVAAALVFSYVAATAVPAASQYKDYWPPEHPHEIFASGFALWVGVLGLAFVFSLFCKLNAKRFHFHRILTLMAVTLLASEAVDELSPTVVYNLHNFRAAGYLEHVAYAFLAFVFFYRLQRYAFRLWSRRHRAAIATGLALMAIVLLEVVMLGRLGYGDRSGGTPLGIAFRDPARLDLAGGDLAIAIDESVAKVDEQRVKILKRVRQQRDAEAAARDDRLDRAADDSGDDDPAEPESPAPAAPEASP